MSATALDVWLRIADDDDHDDFEPLPNGTYPAEANTFADADGFRVEWYLTSVGLVTSRYFPTLDAAHAWLAAQGFEDYTS